jgi:hypothetical protein
MKNTPTSSSKDRLSKSGGTKKRGAGPGTGLQTTFAEPQGSHDGLIDAVASFPEWSEQEVLQEKWAVKHTFEDTDGVRLPRTLEDFMVSYKRASEYMVGESTPVLLLPLGQQEEFFNLEDLPDQQTAVESDSPENLAPSSPEAETHDDDVKQDPSGNENDMDYTPGEYCKPEILGGASRYYQCNRHLLHSDFMRSVLVHIHFLYELFKSSKQQGNTDENAPWEYIYPKGKDGLPTYNVAGKYIIKLFWMGCWRKVVVDDRLPIDSNGKSLVIMSPAGNELWPALLTKAIMKLAAFR